MALGQIDHLEGTRAGCVDNCLAAAQACEWCADEALGSAAVLRDCAESCRQMPS